MAGNTKPIPDSKVRLQFYTEDRQMKARYNMGQPTSMYDYDCASSPSKLTCSTKPDPVELCLSYFAADKKCTRKALESFYAKTAGLKLELKEMREANIKAEEKMLNWKKDGKWGRASQLYRSIGKRQMGLLHITVNQNADDCNLTVTDNFAAVSNGDFIEDAASMVGTNAFLANKDKEMLWKGCTDTDNTLWITSSATIPEKGFSETDAKKTLFSDEEGHFWLLKDSLAKAEKDTTYSYKVWLNGELYEQEKTVSLMEDGKLLKWYYKKNIEKPNIDATDYYLISFETFKQPKGGEKESLGIFCGKFQVGKRKAKT